ncbi:MAG: hypothetical protein ABIQ88_11885 [Chitinophagaceae bacterium]
MKKLNLILGALAISVLSVISNDTQAQKSENIMDVGTITVNIGIGLGRSGYGYNGYNGVGLGYGAGFGTKVAVERGMWQLGPGVLTLGLEAGGSFSKSGGYKSTIIIVAARSAYHFGWNVPNLDTYGGVSLGPGFRSSDYYYNSSSTKTNHDVVVAPGVFVGASYFFSPKIGVNVEAGYDITQIQGGVVFKLN